MAGTEPATDDGPTGKAVRGKRHRLDVVLDMVLERGHLAVDDLVSELDISPATARRDLDALADQQMVVRTHGGASANPDSSSLPLRYRAARNARAKEAIAAAAVDLAAPGSVIGLNGGTTTTALAHELAARPSFREIEQQTVLVTNAINIAQELAVRRHLQLVVTGGIVRESSFELVGRWAEQLLGQVRVDTLFLGVNAVNAVDGASTHDEGEAAISARLIERSSRVVVVADGAKIGATAFARIVRTDGIDDLVTDPSADPEALEKIRGAGIDVHVAEGDGAPNGSLGS